MDEESKILIWCPFFNSFISPNIPSNMAKGRPLQGWWGGAVLLIGIKSFRLPNLTWLYFCTKLYSAMPIDRLFSRDFHLQFHNFCHSLLHSTVKENVESNRSVGHFDSIGVFDSLQLFDWCQISVANYGFISIELFLFQYVELI